MNNLYTIISFLHISSVVGLLVAIAITWNCLWQLRRAASQAHQWIAMFIRLRGIVFLLFSAYIMSGLYLLTTGRGSALGLAVTMFLIVTLISLTERMMYQTRQNMKVHNSSDQ